MSCLEDFFCVTENDDELRMMMSEKILALMGDPEYIFVLIRLMEESESKKDEILQRTVAESILHMITRKSLRKAVDNEYYTRVAGDLFPHLFKSDYIASKTLLNCFFPIHRADQSLSAGFIENCVDFICHSDSIENTSLSLAFFGNFINLSLQKSQNIPLCFELSSSVLKKLKKDYKAYDSVVFHDFVVYSLKLVNELFRIDSEELLISLSEFFDCFIYYITVIDDSHYFSLVKIAVLETIQTAIRLFGLPNNVSERKKPFSLFFINDLSPKIIFSLINLDFSVLRSDVTSTVIFTINKFCSCSICLELILTDEFITKVLIPVTKLLDEDVELFYTIPEQFLAFCHVLNPKENFNLITTRISVFYLLQSISRTEYVSFLSDIYMKCFDPSSGITEFESKLFLLYNVLPYLSIDSDIFEMMMNLAIPDGYPFLYVTLLMFCSNFEYFSEERVSLAVSIIMSDFPLPIKITAGRLFMCAFDSNIMGLDDFISISSFFSQILELISQTKDNIFSTIISTISSLYPTQTEQYSFELISHLLQLWEVNISELEEESLANESDQELLICVSSIIDSLPHNHVQLCVQSEFLISFVYQSLKNYPYSQCESQLFGMIGSIAAKLDDPHLSIFNFFDEIEDFIYENNSYHIISEISNVAYHLMRNHHFFESQKAFSVIKMCDAVFNSCDLPVFCCDAILVLAYFVQISDDIVSFVSTKHLYSFETSDSSVFLSGMILASSGLVKNSSEVSKSFNNDIIDAWISRILGFYMLGKRLIHFAVIGLLHLYKEKEIDQAFGAAMMLLNQGLTNEIDDNCYIVDEEEEEAKIEFPLSPLDDQNIEKLVLLCRKSSMFT